MAGSVVDGSGVIGEDLQAGVQEGGGEGRFAGVSGSGEDDGLASGWRSTGGGVEDGEPLGIRVVGEAGDFLQEDGAGDCGIGFRAEQRGAAEDMEEEVAGCAKDIKDVALLRRWRRRRVGGDCKMSEAGPDFVDEIGVGGEEAERCDAEGIISSKQKSRRRREGRDWR